MSFKISSIHPLRLMAGLLLAAVIALAVYPLVKPASFSYVMLRDDVVIEGGEVLQADDIEEAVLTFGTVWNDVRDPVPGLIPWQHAADYVGLPLVRRVEGGTPLLLSDLDQAGETGIDHELAGGKTGLSIPVDDIVGVTPHLALGDKVHVYASFEDDEGAHTGLLLKKMPVIFLQREWQDETPHLRSVTIALSNREAVLLTHALHYGKIRLGKVSGIGEQESGIGDPVFAATLMKTKKRWDDGEEHGG